MTPLSATLDGNEAVAKIAYQLNEIIAIYPITPASPMGELSDAWAARGKKNIFGVVPEVIEMQSESGAAGTLHGALQTGALGTTFTASQGLLLMIPNMFKIAGELTPCVIHVAARSVATHALSIFGDHSDVMAARTTGFAMMASSSVQEAHDFALLSQAASLNSRVPFLHFFDGFRTSHEMNRIDLIDADDIRALIDEDMIRHHRERALNPEHPVLRGSAQNPDVFFQAREAVNPIYALLPDVVQESFDRFASRTGRHYHLFDYVGHPEADRVIVIMGSGVGAAEEAVDALSQEGIKVGLIKVRLFRPFSVKHLLAALPASVQRIAVLDRTKEPGSLGEPLYQDILTALAQGGEPAAGGRLPLVIGGRYGLSSKEFTPAMAAAVFQELDREKPRQEFTVGIVDDVTHLSLKEAPDFCTESESSVRAVLYGLGSDGTVGASKNAVKIIGENTDLHAQGYFVYDSKKAGAVTVSHLRFDSRPIHSTYLIRKATFVSCHQSMFLERMDVLGVAEAGATFLLNSPHAATEVWDKLPGEVQEQILEKRLRFFVVNAMEVAKNAGLGSRINTVMQTCFLALTDLMPREDTVRQIKKFIDITYGKRGESILRKNHEAVDQAMDFLEEVTIPGRITSKKSAYNRIPESAPEFVKRVTALMLAGKGDLLPVSAMPVDGTFPLGTAQFEKRSIAQEIPIWDPDICIECALCSFVCPHAAIRMKAFDEDQIKGAPEAFPSMTYSGKASSGYGQRMTIQVAPDDCTGCGVCVDVCPARSKEVARHKAINMEPLSEHGERERENFSFFLGVPEFDRSKVDPDGVKGSQLLEPLFEFSGACAGCGETPYLKLLTQLFGDRLIVANATGCSSIYGGNLPTTPWTTNKDGRGPAWANSLFEDNAEFGLGMRLSCDRLRAYALELLGQLSETVGEELIGQIVAASQETDEELEEQRKRIEVLKGRLAGSEVPSAKMLLSVADALVRRSVWIIGGDGWAYDIGFGGLDHVLASGRNVNILVLDTEVYSNTGGQASKATFRGAVAKYTSAGKTVGKKDLGMIAAAYGNVYVAQIALGAHPNQTIQAFRQAESYPGPSLIIAYSTCIAHGIDMSRSMSHQKDLVKSGYWSLYRYDPRLERDGKHPFHLDSRRPSIAFSKIAQKEGRFAMLTRSDPETAKNLHGLAQKDIDERWSFYQQMAEIERSCPDSGSSVDSSRGKIEADEADEAEVKSEKTP